MHSVGARAGLKKIEQFFDGHAPSWDAMTGPGHGARLMALLSALPWRRGGCWLDVGCGTGVMWPVIRAHAGGDARITAVELSAQMLRHVPEARRGMALAVHADALTPPFRDGSFDGVLCNSCFPHFEDQPRAMAVMARLAAPGGMVAVCHSECRAAINERHHRVGGVVGGHDLPDLPEMGALMAAAGLVVTRLSDGPEGYLAVGMRPE